MKKSLLSLLCVVAGVLGLSAAEVTDVLNNAGFGIGTTTNYNTYADKSFTSDAQYTAQAAGDSGTLQLRSKNSNSGIVSTVSGGKLVSVSVKWSTVKTTSSTYKLDIYGSNTAYTAPTDLYKTETAGTKLGTLAVADGDKTLTIEGDYEYIGLRSNNGALYMENISVVWETGSATTKVSRPTITPNGGEISATTEISLGCSTEGAEIWYAYVPVGTDAATVEKQKYTEPFTIPASGTVEAVAKKDGLTDSDIVSVEFTIPEEVAVATIAEAVALNDTKNIVTITGELIATFVNGQNIYVKDATGAMCIYNNTKVLSNIKAGDRLTGVTGKYTRYSAGTSGDAFIPELQDLVADKATVTAGEAVEPDVLAVEEIGADMCASFIKIENATITSNTITDETGTITLYNSFKITLTTGKAKYMTGIVLCYKGALQVAPIEIVPDETAGPVEGGKEDPYTVAKVMSMYEENNAIKQAGWVKGYIVGFISGSSATATSVMFTAEGASASNLVLADSETETDWTKVVAVQLPAGSTPRTALNLLDNPSMLGAQVKIEGSIEKYFGIAGLKSTSDYEVIKTSGVQNVNGAEAAVVKGMIGAISVTGFEGVVEVYNTLGQLVAIAPVAGNAEIPAHAGLAIVKAGDTVVKVIVK